MMGYIDYSKEPQSDIAFVDMKSFYASVECVDRGLNPLHTSLCVMSRADNAGGLILASSPMFKKVFGKNNVGRAYDLPFDISTRKFDYYNAKRQGLDISPRYISYIEHWAKRTLIVPPRMDRKAKLDVVSAKLQHDIWKKTGIYSTIGMSNANPLLAKLALDNEAKRTPTMRANWSYEDVETKVWSIPNLTDFWGIGSRTEKRLHKLGIASIKELANSNPDRLKKEFGKVGVQFWFHANGVDESNVHQPYKPKSHGLGNSQVLPRDYVKQRDIEIVLSEMAEQVAIRMRREHQKATIVSIFVTYSKTEMKQPINAQMKIEPTNHTRLLTDTVLTLFRKKYTSGAVRGIAVNYSGFVDENYALISLFDDIEATEKEENLQRTIDHIRDQFGFLAVQKGTALLDSSRNIARSKLIGGHSAGGLEGLQ